MKTVILFLKIKLLFLKIKLLFIVWLPFPYKTVHGHPSNIHKELIYPIRYLRPRQPA